MLKNHFRAQNVPSHTKKGGTDCMYEEQTQPQEFFECTSGESFAIILVAGKHVRVWTGSYSAVLHRSPSLYSAYSASFSSLTRANTLTDIFHLFGFRLGSTEGQIKQKLQNSSFLIYKQPTAHLCSGGRKKKLDQLLVFFALSLTHLLVFQGLSAKYRTRMCRVCMLLKLGRAC